MNRREFSGYLARFLGLSAAFGPTLVMDQIIDYATEPDRGEGADNNLTLTKALSVDRLFHISADEILRAFRQAPTGTLMMYYQLFWPIFLGSDLQIERRIQEIVEVSDASLKEKGERLHRVRVLPAVAAVHTLSSVTDQELTEYCRALIRKIHRHALEIEPNREVIEIIWQNMTAALIKDRSSWERLNARYLIDEAEVICDRYLKSGDDVLLTAAVAAWQFLLTYERALTARRIHSEDLSRLKSAMASIRSQRGHRQYWLVELERIYNLEKRQSLEQMLPHTWEVVMGKSNPSNYFGEAAEYFTVMRLQMNYTNFESAGGKSSDYQKMERANELVQTALTFLAKFGFSKLEWAKLKQSKSALILPNEALSYFDDVVFKPSGLWEQTSAFEMANNPRLAEAVPFKRIYESNVVEQLWPEIRNNPEKLAKAVAERNHESFWKEVGAFSVAQEVAHRRLAHPDDIRKKVQNELDEELVKLNADETIREAALLLREEASPFIGKTTVSVGFSPAESAGAQTRLEGVMGPKTRSNKLRSLLAKLGEGRLEAKNHPEPELLESYSLNRDEQSREVADLIQRHISMCDRCRRTVEDTHSKADYFRRMRENCD